MFDGLKVGLFRLRIAVRQRMELPSYKGSVLRGGFGSAFRRVSCALRATDCRPCDLRQVCPYAYIFETSPTADAGVLRTLQDVPRPFVFEPPQDERTSFEPGEELEFGLVLIGKGVDYLPYFVVAFRELGRTGIGPRRAGFSLRLVEQLGSEAWSRLDGPVRDSADGNPKVAPRTECGIVFDGREGNPGIVPRLGDVPYLDREALALQADRLRPDRVLVEFRTMARLKAGNELDHTPGFQVLVRALLRRVSSLAVFHHGTSLELDYRSLIDQAGGVRIARDETRWVDWTRHSNRQNARMNLGGLVGRVVYEGDISPFRELLVLGSYVHVGKNTTFGLGKYSVR